MWSMVNRDHYWLFIENIAPTVAVVKGDVVDAVALHGQSST
jgi:hypothetical protein